MSENWKDKWLSVAQHSPFAELEHVFHLSQLDGALSAKQLNQLKAKINPSLLVDFVCQNELPDTALYYESIIAQQNRVPTRLDSWHDWFNGLVWLQFPLTKGLFNRWHVEDITQHGISPRTHRRNLLTHFDECGVILAVTSKHITGLLEQHQWQSAFVTHRQAWGQTIQPFVFGHANYEMLLNPFIGLTGKWLAVEVEADFFGMDYLKQLKQLDHRLSLNMQKTHLFAQSYSQVKPLRPLPLLGVPKWHTENQSPEFYANAGYFRPLYSAKGLVKE